MVEFERKATEEDIVEFVRQKPKRYTELRKYIEDKIREQDIDPMNHSRFIKIKKELEAQGRIFNQNGLYTVEIPKYRIDSSSTVNESLEIIESPFVGKVKFFVLNDLTSFGIIRTKSYITNKLDSGNQVEILRLERHQSAEYVIYMFAVLVLSAGKITEVYISNSPTGNSGAAGVSFYQNMSEFITANKLDEHSINVGSMEKEELQEKVIRHLVLYGYM